MKTLHRLSLVVWLFLPLLLSAQPLSIMSSTPTDNSAGVALNTTIVIKWSQPLKPGTVSLDSIGDRFMVFPEDKITIHSVSYADNQTELRFEVTHQADTDYVWSFFALQSMVGTYQGKFEILRYTTRAVASPLVISGRLMMKDPGMAPNFSNAVVMLLSDLSFLDSENDEGPGDAVKSATKANPVTGEYSLLNVQSGTYYLMAMLFSIVEDRMETIGIGIYADGDGKPLQVSIGVNSLMNMNLDIDATNSGGSDPVDATQAFSVIDAMMSVEHPQAKPVLMEGDSPEFPALGESKEWMVAYFNEVDSMVTMVLSDGNRILSTERVHLMSISENERPPVDMRTIKPIPKSFISSRVAYQTALQNGLHADISSLPPPNNSMHQEVNYRLSQFYFEYPDLTNADSNPFWQIRYQTQTMMGYAEVVYLIDAVSGVYIGKTSDQETWNQGKMELISSAPTSMSTRVPLQTRVSFTFSEPIHIHSLNLDTRTMTWTVYPMDRITIQKLEYSEDYKTVFMDVTHAAETDYVWTFSSIRSVQGAGLMTAAVVQYTTQATISPLRVNGLLAWPEGEITPQPSQAMAVVVLFQSPNYVINGMEGVPVDVLNVGANDLNSWTYSIANVRPGTYYPTVFVFSRGAEFGDLIAYGFIAPSSTDSPGSFTITNQSQSNVNLPMWFVSNEPDRQRIDVLQVFDKVKQHVAGQATGAELITAYGSEEVKRPMMPTGTSSDWSFIYFESATDTIQMMQADSEGIFKVDRFHLNNVPEEERIPKELIKPLPTSFIGSSQALNIAMNNGLAELINSTPSEAWAEVRFSLSNFYFQYPDMLSNLSPPFWDIQYNAERWTMANEINWSREANFLVDAVTGTLINKQVTTGLDEVDVPLTIQLDQNYPNPFNPTTVISFTVETQDLASPPVRLAVFDILGREVAVLVERVMPAGSHSVVFDASALPSGVYLYRLVAGGETIQRKMTVLK